MKLIAFQPSSNWEALKRNAILLVTLGVAVVFGVILFTLPISSMRALTIAGKKLFVIGSTTISLGVTSATNATTTASNTVKKVGELVQTGVRGMADKVQDMIHFITGMIEDMYAMFGKVVRLSINSTTKLIEAVSKASEFVLESMSKISRTVVENIKRGMETVMKILMKSQETLADAIEHCFVPAVESFLKITYKMGKVGVKIYTRYLPAAVRYMYFFAKFAISQSVANTNIQVNLSVLSLFTSLFSKLVTDTTGTLENIVTVVAGGASTIIPIFLENVKDLSGDMCDLVVTLVNEDTPDLFPELPVGLDLDDSCSTEFITLGLKWMSMGTICGNGYPDTLSLASTCLFRQVANITFVPSVGGSISAEDIVGDLPYPFDKIISSLGSISFSIPSFSLSSLVSGLQGIITRLFGEIETYLFRQARTSRRLIFSMVRTTGTKLSDLIYQLIYRLLENAANFYFSIMTSRFDSLVSQFCSIINGASCVTYPDFSDWSCKNCWDELLIEICSPPYPCPKSYCLTSAVNCNNYANPIKNFIVDRISGLSGYSESAVRDYLVSLFLGSGTRGSW